MRYLSITTYKIFMFLSLALFIFYACSNEPIEDEFLIDKDPTNNEAPATLANASPLSGDLPLEISFISTKSTDNNRDLKYSWDFKDGTTSNSPDPKHSFKAVGDYNVELTVTDDLGMIHKDSVSIRIRDSKNRAPQAKIRANPRSGSLPLKVDFKGSHSRDDNGITEYYWDFKDGSTSDLADVSHTFETAGIYEVELKVKDEIGLFDKETIEITVIGDKNEAPVAIASASPLTGTLPLEVSFKGSNSTDDTGVENFSWDFSDGSTSEIADPKNTFDTAGTYDVVLTVTDELGLTHKDSIAITVSSPENEAPVAVVSASPISGTMPLEVSFTGSNSTDDDGVESHSWDFKDGSTSEVADPKNTFDTAGTYEVVLTVKDAVGLSHKQSITITVADPENEAPVAVVSASPLSGTLPLEVSFTGSNSSDDIGVESYSWDFKDGSTANIADPKNTFDTAGTYDVELTVTDAKGLTHKKSITITVADPENEAPVAVVSASPLTGIMPLSVNFTGSNSTDDVGVESFSWDFKDGSTADIADPKNTFDTAGTYNVELTVTDAKGLSHKKSVTITVDEPENEAPVAVVSANPLSGTVPLEVSFNGSNSTDDSGVESYSWDFKDGSTSTASNPKHTFNSAGNFNVELTVKDAQGLTHKKAITITVDEPLNEAPRAIANASPLSGEAPLQVDFSGSSSTDDSGVVSYSWDIPGNPSSGSNVSHTFNDPGVYDISLTVRDAEGLEDTAALTITVNQGSAGSTDGGQIPCSVGGGTADETGSKIWCWSDHPIPDYSNSKGTSFSNNQLYVDSECYEKQVSNVGDRLRFYVDPVNPATESWCSQDYNMRAEVRTAPWNVRHPVGTEEWFGWSYTFGNDYVIDRNSEWLFFQVHPGILGKSPQLEFLVTREGQFSGHGAGEIYIVNKGASSNRYNPTGITPRAGETLDIVVHTIWGDSSNGMLQVWINGSKVYDKQVSTVYPDYPWGGNAKWGIYKWPWRNSTGVQESLNQGVTHLETYMGSLRIITRKPGDADYGKDSYSMVAPR